MEEKVEIDDRNSLFGEEIERGPKQGTFVGTPYYTSPEMIEVSQTGPGNDMWALGVILY